MFWASRLPVTPQALALGHSTLYPGSTAAHRGTKSPCNVFPWGLCTAEEPQTAAGWMRRVTTALCPRRCRNCRLQITSEHHVPQHVSENYSDPQAVSIAELSCQALLRAGRNLRVGGVRSRARFIFQACLPCVSEGLCSNMQKAMLLKHLMEPTSCVELLS